MKIIPLFFSPAFLFLCGVPALSAADPVVMSLPPGNYARKLGSNAVEDPSGAIHTKQEVRGRVMVGIFITPNLTEGVKRRWAYLLADKASTRLPDSVALVMIENIAAAGGFKKMGKDSVKSDFIKGERPFTVLDYTGRVFKRFGISGTKTEILIFDKKGRLRDVENDLSDEALTLRRVRSIVAYLEKE